MPWLYAGTLFLGAFLLFVLQPLVGKMLLPLWGGTPALWNTCMVFFQAILLAGYGYTHVITSVLGSRRQTLLHCVLLLMPVAVLPIGSSVAAMPIVVGVEYPVLTVLQVLLRTVGLPFFVLATSGPLLQKWFADSGHTAARDPYYLYTASNLGSLLALAAYPTLLEPTLRLAEQSWVWTVSYLGYGVLVVLCGVSLWRQHPHTARQSRAVQPSTAQTPLTWKRRWRWMALAFVPSSFLLGCTTYVSTDITPMPLLWVIPLVLYLLSFIAVFATKPWLSHCWMRKLLPMALLMLTLVLLTGATALRGLPVAALLALHLGTLFLTAMVGHGELAQDRPAAEYLTEFYLWLAVGGVLGGVFNTLLAPLLFHRTGLTEYPVAVILASLLSAAPPSARERVTPPPAFVLWDVILPVAVGLGTVGLLQGSTRLGLDLAPTQWNVLWGVPCVLVYLFVSRRGRYALGLMALFVAAMFHPQQTLVHVERNFFGVLKIVEVREAGHVFRKLFHGNTIHGQQSLEQVDAQQRHEPMTYYHRTGPIGQVFTQWVHKRPTGQKIGVVGLGTGSLAYYARPGDQWTFYEIDPAVQRIAAQPHYFAFLQECHAGMPQVILGDARLRLQEVAPQYYDVLVLDAFSSDAVPVHLLTQEAVQLYVDKLQSGGLLALHVSNRYVDLWPILARLAEHASPTLVIRGRDDQSVDQHIGKMPSQWIIMARSEADLGTLVHDRRWERIQAAARTPLWTDDFSNVLSALQW